MSDLTPQAAHVPELVFAEFPEVKGEGWRVLVGCDAEVGEQVRNNPYLHNDLQLEIDAATVEQTVRIFGIEGNTGTLLFQISTPQTIAEATARMFESTSARQESAAGFCEKTVSKEGKPRITVHISSDYVLFSARGVKQGEDEIAVDAPLAQLAAAHELQHAADFTNPVVMTYAEKHAHRFYTRFLLRIWGEIAAKSAVAGAALIGGAALAGYAIGKRKGETPSHSAISLGAVGAIATMPIAEAIHKKVLANTNDPAEDYYHVNPIEVRARATEEYAPSLPPFIRIIIPPASSSASVSH